MTSRKKKTACKTTSAAKPAASKKAGVDGAKLLRLLERHALGQVEMTATQVSVALALLKITGPAEGSATPSHEDALSALA